MEIKHRHTGAVLLEGEPGMTVRYALEKASQSKTNLSDANLSGEILTKSPISIVNLPNWNVLITEGFMVIGCQRHSHADWAAFDDSAIAKMDGRNALRFWREWKIPLLAMCTAHSIKNTGDDNE